MLDLVLSNDPYIISSIDVTEPFSNSDHCVVNFSLLLDDHEKADANNVRFVYDFDNCNEDALSLALLNHPFNSTMLVGSADIIWDQFIEPSCL